jgi:hypothetical protein
VRIIDYNRLWRTLEPPAAAVAIVWLTVRPLLFRRQLALDLGDAKKLTYLLRTTERSLLPYERKLVERQLEDTRDKIIRTIAARTLISAAAVAVFVWLIA